MTTEVLGRDQTSACNGVTTAFPVNFQFGVDAELKVYLLDAIDAPNAAGTLLVEGGGADYTVTGSGPAGTASVHTLVAQPAGKFLRRFRLSLREQSADYIPNDGFPSATQEAQLDRLTRVDQEQDDDLARADAANAATQAALDDLGGRALRYQVGQQSAELDKAAFAGKFYGGDAGGNPVPLVGTGNDAALRVDLASAVGPALIGLGNGSTLDDMIRINAARYGFHPARTAAQNQAAWNDIVVDVGGGAQPVVVDIPPGAYDADILAVDRANLWVDAHGSTFLEGAELSVSPAGAGFKLKNARFYLDTAAAIITHNSSGGGLRAVEVEKFGAADGYMMVTEGGASDNMFSQIKLKNGNGWFIEGERLNFNDIQGQARAAGGDDFLKFAARNRRTGDITMTAIFGKGFGSLVATGGEIGTLGAASPGRAGRLENVRISAVGRDCDYGFFGKPGAVSHADPLQAPAYDWRDGLMRGLKIDLKLFDADGSKMRRGAVISAARNALVEKIGVRLDGEGRFANSPDDECWAHVFLPDSTAWLSGGAGGTIRRITVAVDGQDPYGGLDGGGASPGYPARCGVIVEKQAAGVGTFDDIRLTGPEGAVRIDGTKGAGIQVSAGCDNAVTIDKFIGSNLAVNPATTTGGIHAESVVRAPGENEISMANAGSKPIYVAGAGDVIGRRITVDIAAAGGVDATLLRQLPHDTWLRKVSGVGKDAVGASVVAYLGLELRAVNGLTYDGAALNGNALTIFDTSVTAIAQFVPFNFPAMPANIGAGASFVDRFLKAGAVVRVIKTNTGGGQAFVGSVDVHYVQIGARS